MIGRDSSEIFESCVQAILEGRATVEQCAARFPEVDGLHEALQAVQMVQLLPQGALSPVAARRILDQRLTPKMQLTQERFMQRSLSARPRRFPWAYAATAAVIFALILFAAFIANNRTPTPQIAVLPTRTASPAQNEPTTASGAEGTSSDDFAVMMELTGTIETVALADRAHGLMVTLEDGTTIRFDAPLTTDNVLTPGLAITVIAAIDNGNQFVARTVTINGDATLMPVATQEAAVSTNGPCDKSPQPVAARLADSFDVDTSEIMGWFCKGYGFGEIAKAYLLAKNGKLTVDRVFDMRASGQGWGLIAKNLGVSSKDMAKPLNGNAAIGGTKPGKGPKNKGKGGNSGDSGDNQ